MTTIKGCKLIVWGSYYECTGNYPICEGCEYNELRNSIKKH